MSVPTTFPPGPWMWAKPSGSYELFTESGGMLVVLGANLTSDFGDWDPPGRPVLAVRDASGVLVPITPEHPVAKILRAAPELLAACEAVLLWFGPDAWTNEIMERWLTLTGRTESTSRALCDFVRAALAKTT